MSGPREVLKDIDSPSYKCIAHVDGEDMETFSKTFSTQYINALRKLLHEDVSQEEGSIAS